MLGFKGPRKMTIVLPGMGVDHKRIPVQPKMVGFFYSLFHVTLCKCVFLCACVCLFVIVCLFVCMCMCMILSVSISIFV